ncbi:MAG: hypothetical protein ACD_33C00033G0002 [uncultured bacterium]|nr:MAG: hypothetical protein ACD_33C00033G0002 [uncultured bacterium]
MSMNIINFIKRLLPSFNKSDILTDMEVSIEYISNILDSYASYESVLKVTKITAKKNKDVLKEFYKDLKLPKSKVKLSNNENIATDMLTLFKNVKVNGDYILEELDGAINDVIVSEALTAYKAFLIRSIGHYYFMTKFATDLLNFIYINETLEVNEDLDKEYKLNKKQEENIVKNIWIFARLLSLYGLDHETFKDNISSIENITLPKEEVEKVVNIYNSGNVDAFNNLPSGFIGSPIYSIRLVFAQWQSQRHHELKDKKKLLELRYLHYKLLKESGQSDVNVENEIIYLQKRLSDIDYKLAKLEEGVNDE